MSSADERVKNLKLFKNFQIYIFQIGTNKPSFGSVVLEITLDTRLVHADSNCSNENLK